MRIKIIIMSSVLALSVSLKVMSAAGTANIIEGFAKWQADRVEKIILDESLSNIAKDRWVKRYFSNTAQSISLYNNVSATRLIPLIQSNIQQDLTEFDQLGRCLETSVRYWMSDGDTLSNRSKHALEIYSAL